MAESNQQIVVRYLDDTIAAEKTFETQLRGFAGEGNDETVRQLFSHGSVLTRLETNFKDLDLEF